MNTLVKFSARALVKEHKNKIVGGAEDTKPKTSHTRPLTGFYSGAM
ncbi:hypothetical protein ACJD0Z_05765 [Flavobacteriaceae bacterium M23B6Z8]